MIKSVDDLYSLAGGTLRLASAINVHQVTIERWNLYGIPQKHWSKIIKKFDVTPAELFHVSEIARRNRVTKMG